MTTDTAPTEEMQLAPPQPGEPPMKQLAPYDEFKSKIESIKKTAETITVTDISQTAEMKIARATRLSLREIRIEITHRHEELKRDILLAGRKIDSRKNELLAVIEPLELRLKDQEDFIEKETDRIQKEKHVARMKEITPFLTALPMFDLGAIADEQYAGLLQDAKDGHAARLAREQREKEEAAAKLKAEAEERERILVENERLKKEAEEREALARKEREAAAAEKARLDKQLADERKAAEEKAAKVRKEAVERERVIQARGIEAFRIESEKARAQATRAEVAIAAAKKERAEAAKENARLAAIAEAAEREAREAREKAEAELIAKREAERAAAMAPEKEKLIAFAKAVRTLATPLLSEAKAGYAKELAAEVEKLAKWVEKKSEAL